ncbi:MAG: hypothetical protein QXE66_03510, partial [Desulfurococcaceae archaeon]
MIESYLVKMDRFGRILIPSSVRRRVGARVFMLEVLDDGELRLKPLGALKLTDLFDAIEVDVEDFADTHALKGALYREG